PVCLPRLRGEKRGEILLFDPYSDRYSFASPLYRAYGLLRFRDDLRVREFNKLLAESDRFASTALKLLQSMKGVMGEGD
ncbi:unnamed protein product, partial [marine sediment metagenome]